MAGVLSRFSYATATTTQQLKNGSKNENTVKSTAPCSCRCLGKGITKQIGNYEPTQLNTLLERFCAEIKKTWLNLANDYSISSKVIWTRTEQFLELFNRTLYFFQSRRCENINVYYCFDRTRLFFYRKHLQGLNKLFLHLMHALCFCIIMIIYLVFFHVYYQYVIT